MVMKDDDQFLPPSGRRTPVPDPTELTTQQLREAIASVKELLTTRIDAIDQAQIKFVEGINRVPSDTDKQIVTLAKLFDEKLGVLNVSTTERFNNVAMRFNERDIRFDQAALHNQISLEAALNAAKEAVAEQNRSNNVAISKSEAAFTKQIDNILDLMKQNAKATDEKIDDIKTQLLRIEGRSKGLGDGWGYIVGFFAVIGVIIAFATLILNR